MKDEAQGDDFKAHFYTEDGEEVRLSGAQPDGQVGLVSVRKMFLQGHHHAGGDDGGQHRPLEGRPLDDEEGESPYDVTLTQQEEGGGGAGPPSDLFTSHHSLTGYWFSEWTVIVSRGPASSMVRTVVSDLSLCLLAPSV